MKTFPLRFILPTSLSILLFILTIFLIVIPRYKENIMHGKREMIKELTNSAWSILNKYHKDEVAGVLTPEQARDAAISRIRYLRYGDESKDYFWITDMSPRMVMHPFRDDLNGKDLSNFQDPHGKRMFVAFVETVKNSDQGYVDYMWQWKDDSLHIVPKVSYVKIFRPWNWVIGTGIYIEDAKKEIASMTRNLIWLSVGISILIAFLLFYILQQSIKVENKRIEAESELHESKERYRTLVEAATEGILMVIDGRISYSNSVICKMTGYDEQELYNRPFHEIISKSNNRYLIEAFSKNSFQEGSFEINLVKNDGNILEVLITSSTSALASKIVNILIIKDITTQQGQEFSNLEYKKLLKTLNVGFFKAKLDSKGTLLYANETALKILGIESLEDISSTSINELLADVQDRKSLMKKLVKTGFLKNKIIKINKKSGEFSIVSVTLVVINNDNSHDLVCDGIIEDITKPENEKKLTSALISELRLGGINLEQSVRDFMSPLVTLDADSILKEVIVLMNKKKTDCILMTKNQSDYLGIITRSDIQHRILSLELSMENPAYLIMSSPIISIQDNMPVLEAIHTCEEKKIHHLVVRNESNTFLGVISMEKIYQSVLHSYSYLTTVVSKHESIPEIRDSYLKVQNLIKALIKSDISIHYITRITSTFSDAVVRRVIELSIPEIGQPPVDFAFICLGSEGRKEETLFTDQDNAIIFEDVNEEISKTVQDYFRKLGAKVNDSLDEIGYSYCKGNIMAGNPQWSQPFSVWERYFNSWINAPEPQNLLDAIIFFDFRYVYGNEDLTERLRTSIRCKVKDKPAFKYHLAYHTCMTKPVHISGSILSEKHSDIIDLKYALLPIVMFVRTYSISNDIWYSNTIERLNALKERGLLNESMVDDLLFIYDFLMRLRFRNQADLSEKRLQMSNAMNTKKLPEIELVILKKAISSIPDYQAKIKADFSVSI